MAQCTICSQDIDINGADYSTIGEDGLVLIKATSSLRRDGLNFEVNQKIHKSCRKKYTDKRKLSKLAEPSSEVFSPSRRSNTPHFDFLHNCILCGQIIDTKSDERDSWHKVETFSFKERMEGHCEFRKDEWATMVRCRIEYAQDLQATDTLYHQVCSTNFRTNRQIPSEFITEERRKRGRPKKLATSRGRPNESDLEDAFINVANHIIEHEEKEFFTLSNLKKIMQSELIEVNSEKAAFTTKHLRRRLEEHFKENILVLSSEGQESIVIYRNSATNILRDFHASTNGNLDAESQKMEVIKAAAQLIKSEIKERVQSRDDYPSTEVMESVESNINYLTKSLKVFLMTLFDQKNAQQKISSIGQSIMQCVRPRTLIPPAMLGLAVQMHFNFASRFLIDTLFAHGFCSSYSEVQMFERSAALHRGTKIPGFNPSIHKSEAIADNGDHNTRTLDGFNTMHVMCIIKVVTPAIKQSFIIPRVKVNTKDILACSKINVRYFKRFFDGLSIVKFRDLNIPVIDDPSRCYDILWKSVGLLRRVPSYSGFMQQIQKGDYPGTSSVFFMPIIDLDPTDESCVFSTMMFAVEEAKRQNTSAVLTFDQSLWWKAYDIRKSEPPESILKSLVLRLGGFHGQMSFMGSIGTLMHGSGLKELIENIYSETTTSSILSGKAYSRALRAHILIYRVLSAIIISEAYAVDFYSLFHEQLSDTSKKDGNDNEDEMVSKPNKIRKLDTENDYEVDEILEFDDEDFEEEIELAPLIIPEDLLKANELIHDLLSDSDQIAVTPDNPTVKKLVAKIENFKERVSDQRTAVLWLQYMKTVELLLTDIKAERTSNWKLSLMVQNSKLPFYAASGHNNYTKSTYLHLQDMEDLPLSHPELYESYLNGYHSFRRSDRFWAGLPPDYLIESVLMRAMKSRGGLTRGRGVEEPQRSVWLLSTPACAEVNGSMQNYTGIEFSSSEQHKDTSETRINRDLSDMTKIAQFLIPRNPFQGKETLQSIATGIEAAKKVNVDKAEECGKKIINSMVGQTVSDLVMKKKSQAVTMESVESLQVEGESVKIDSMQLFQRLLTTARNKYTDDNIKDLFQYELSSQPAALFDRSGLMNEANKASLAQYILSKLPSKDSTNHQKVSCGTNVVDGGALLHRTTWAKNDTFGDIYQRYVKLVVDEYSVNSVVVFDSYKGPSTKSSTHLRRNKGTSATVHFNKSTRFGLKKENFLSNEVNKQNFIDSLTKELESVSIKVIQAPSDADLIIAKTAVKIAEEGTDVTVVGNDTDLLILLLFYANTESNANIYLKHEGKRKSKNNKSAKYFNIMDIKKELGSETCRAILFAHAFLGCDTTSRVFDVGKSQIIKKFSNECIKTAVSIFNNKESSQAEIIEAGEKALLSLYGSSSDSLDAFRYRKFHEKTIVKKTFVKPEDLPPTSNAMKFHSLRVYHQIQAWQGNDLDANEWGFYLMGTSMLLPVKMDIAAAPSDLLSAIRCKCASMEPCKRKSCTCKKFGLECGEFCDCKGVSCFNSPPVDFLTD